jgi:Ribbon-helix-helix protein, copG family
MKELLSVSPDLVEKIEQFCLETGRGVRECMEEALTEWLETTAASQLELVRRPEIITESPDLPTVH